MIDGLNHWLKRAGQRGLPVLLILMIVLSPFTTVYAESGSPTQAASSSTLPLTGLNDSGGLAAAVSK